MTTNKDALATSVSNLFAMLMSLFLWVIAAFMWQSLGHSLMWFLIPVGLLVTGTIVSTLIRIKL